jgi:hypothetical protein
VHDPVLTKCFKCLEKLPEDLEGLDFSKMTLEHEEFIEWPSITEFIDKVIFDWSFDELDEMDNIGAIGKLL